MPFEEVLEELWDLCASEDELSLDALREKINLLPPSYTGFTYYDNRMPFFHRACMNKNITSEIIKYLLQKFPSAASITTDLFCGDRSRAYTEEAYPLHLCCYNENCPNSVIEILVKKYPEAISAFSLVKEGINSGEYDGCYVEGLPIHYYLSRTTSNVDIDTVKMLVQTHPDSLISAGDEMECYPLHALLCNPNVSNLLEILAYLIESFPDTIKLPDAWRRRALHIACRSKGITLEVFQLILNAWPAGFRQRDHIGSLPFHTLCFNEYLDEDIWFDIFDVMMNIDPSIVRGEDDYGGLPIHRAAAAQSVNVCKKLINLYPESLRGIGDGSLPIHDACSHGRVKNVSYLLAIYPESIHVRDSVGRLPIHNAANINHTGIGNGRKETIDCC